jgi:hypothetical protein
LAAKQQMTSVSCGIQPVVSGRNRAAVGARAHETGDEGQAVAFPASELRVFAMCFADCGPQLSVVRYSRGSTRGGLDWGAASCVAENASYQMTRCRAVVESL